MSTDEFDFRFGKDRYLRGRGWRGIIALVLILASGVAMGSTATGPLLRFFTAGVAYLVSTVTSHP
jgi:hypothetical protein